MHARIYDFTLIAGGMQRLPVVGDFFKVISATGVINVNVDTGATLDLMPGQGLRELNFNTLTITDKSGAANSGKILVGFSGMIDDRVSGEVSVIDGGKSRVLSNASGMASIAYGTASNPGVGQYQAGALWNPAGSGKRIVVSQIIVQGEQNAGVLAVRYITATFGAQAAADAVASKYAAQAHGLSAQVWVSTTLAAPVGASFGGRVYVGATMAPVVYRPTEPWVLAPGVGLVVAGVTLQAGFSGAVDFFEEPV